MTPPPRSHSTPRRIAAHLVEVVLLVLLWLVLTRADPRGFVFGTVVVGLAVALRAVLAGTHRWSFRVVGLARFVPFFLWHSVLGGADVALRALRPSLPIEPRMLRHPLGLPAGPARAFFVGVVSLLPGTLSADLEHDMLDVHVIAGGDEVAGRLVTLEEAVAEVFGGASGAAGGEGD